MIECYNISNSITVLHENFSETRYDRLVLALLRFTQHLLKWTSCMQTDISFYPTATSDVFVTH